VTGRYSNQLNYRSALKTLLVHFNQQVHRLKLT